MKTFIQNLRLARKMIIAPGVMMVFLILFAVGSYVGLRKQQDALEFFVNDELRSSVMIDRASQDIAEAQGNIYKMITWGQAGFDQAKVEAVGKVQFANIDSAIILLKVLADSTVEPLLKEKYTVAVENAEKYRKTIATVVDLGSVDLNSATMAMVTAEERFDVLSAKLKEARDIEAATSRDAYAAATAGYHEALWMFLIILALALSLSAAITFWITKIINDPLQAVNRILGRVADGNVALKDNAQRIADGDASAVFTLEPEEVAIHQNDEVGLLAESTRKIVASQGELADAFKRVAQTLDALMKETSLLAASAVNGELAARGEEQKFKGGYRAIVKGVNDTLDAVIGPLNVAAQYVDAISKGNIPEKIVQEYKGDFNTIKTNLNLCIDAVNALVQDAQMLAGAAIAGDFERRADDAKHRGDFAKVVTGVNRTLDVVVDKVFWYEALLDNIPWPISVTDMDMNWTFVNRTVEQFLNIKRKDVLGHQCSEWKAGICKTENCGIAGLRRNILQTKFAQQGMDFQVDTSYILNRKGEKVGHIEVVQDITSRERATQYQAREVERLESNLRKLATGDLSLDLALGEADQYTKTVRSDFERIAGSLAEVKRAVGSLIDDAVMLSRSAVEGKLSTRADMAKHQGDYRKIISGVNETLDAIIKPIQDSAAVLQDMARGNLAVRLQAEYQGDHRLIKDAINQVGASLDNALREVWEAVSATASASNQISASTEEMAAGAQEQTSQASQVASAVEEMTKTILENSQNASATANVAKQAKTSAESGGAIVSETVSGMRRIAAVVEQSALTVKELGKSSDQIGEIVTVIDDIADQTNLLALNAAIEAARAGDQGRGFAVVADEVRKLAERTTKATKEIAEMIRKIQTDTQGAVKSMEEGTKQVDAGIHLADQAGTSLQEIVHVSQRVTDMVMQIAVASEQQSSASEQISKNVEAISSVTNQTAGGTQQIARAANDLNALTENLQRLIGRFQLSGEHGAAQDAGKEGRSSIAVRANGKLVRH